MGGGTDLITVIIVQVWLQIRWALRVYATTN